MNIIDLYIFFPLDKGIYIHFYKCSCSLINKILLLKGLGKYTLFKHLTSLFYLKQFFLSPSEDCEILSKQIKKKTFSVISLQILDNQEVQATMILPRILQVNMCSRTFAI